MGLVHTVHYLDFSSESWKLVSNNPTIFEAIVDNVVRGMKLLVSACKKPKRKRSNFNNKKALASAVSEIKNNLKRRATLA